MEINKLTTKDFASGELNVLIETPKGSRNKYTYDEKLDAYELTGTLPVGASFPYDFGFVPFTLGQDGDPLDVLLLMEEPAFTGCLVKVRLIGVLEAEQTEEGKTVRNDRLIAVYAKSPLYQSIHSLDQLEPAIVEQITHFFKSYNEIKGKLFKLIGQADPLQAYRLIEHGERMFKEKKEGKRMREE